MRCGFVFALLASFVAALPTINSSYDDSEASLTSLGSTKRLGEASHLQRRTDNIFGGFLADMEHNSQRAEHDRLGRQIKAGKITQKDGFRQRKELRTAAQESKARLDGHVGAFQDKGGNFEGGPEPVEYWELLPGETF